MNAETSDTGGASDRRRWFENVSNYDGVVDTTGKSKVAVEVGAKGDNGNFAFGPAAVRVDPGTNVVWKWNGKGGSHNVVSESGAFESEMVGEEGHQFSHLRGGRVQVRLLAPQGMGMKGAVAVGTEGATEAESASASGDSGMATDELLTLGVGGALVAGLLGLPFSEMRRRDGE
ncbi:halocyanin domain-containing protein [Halorussus ruber]|uniref:halocyanin domain-containing protein n=1 Tax=Halorussus ruber TaxID=1126238 RepID=UPI001FE5A91C|nr:halocyanin domain-containing protein [Halorussus ruber]